jgi:alanine dehydrogenase
MKEEVAIIGNGTVQKYLSVLSVIERVEQTYKWYAEGKIIMPSKITLDMAPLGVEGWINSMPSYIQPCDIAGIKWVGGFSNNHKLGLPYIKAKILLTDPGTGLLKALIDGDWISDMRTGAQTAVFAKYLAGNNKDIVTIIGAGIQGYTTLLCLCELFEFREIRICDINPDAGRRFITKAERVIKSPIKAFESIKKAAENADIIVTATTADKPLVMNEWVKPGALVSTLGSYQELDEQLVFKADKVIVDHIGQHLHRGEFVKLFESGKLKESDIYGEFPDILAGKLAGRTNDQERIVISIVGMGCLDVSVAAMLYESAASDKNSNLYFFDLAS